MNPQAQGTNAAQLNPAMLISGMPLPLKYLQTSGASNGDVITYNSATGEYEPQAGGGGGISELTGDVTAGPGSGSQAATIANNAVTTAKILNANVTLAKLASGITPSHVIKFAGQTTTAGGSASEAITVTGALNTDLAFVQMVNDGTGNVTIVNAVVTADTLTVTFSADPGNDCVVNYQIIRAAS